MKVKYKKKAVGLCPRTPRSHVVLKHFALIVTEADALCQQAYEEGINILIRNTLGYDKKFWRSWEKRAIGGCDEP